MSSTTISAYSTTPVTLNITGAELTLTATGTIAAAAANAVLLAGTHETLQNAGHLASNNTGAIAYNPAFITNTGLILGYQTGLSVRAGAVISNAGTILSGALSGTGISLDDADTLTNTGLITAHNGIFYWGAGSGAPATIINSGTIAGTDSALWLINANATIINEGLITGGAPALIAYSAFGPPVNLDLILTPGSTLNGGAAVSGGNFALDLAAQNPLHPSQTTGTLDLAPLTGLTSLTFDPGSAWTLDATTSELSVIPTITGLTGADELILSGPTSLTIGTPGLVTLTSGSVTTTLAIAGAEPATTQLTQNLDGTYALTTQAICYLKGTHILTPTGEKRIESLNIGDQVITRFGGIRPIIWIGHQTHHPSRFTPGIAPIRFARNTLGPDQPTRPLYVSPGHAMLVDGKLILAHLLINFVTITQDTCPPTIEYYQLDLGVHDCLIAEGTYAESYADTGTLRDQFDNAAQFHALYPNHLPPEDLQLCAPRPEKGRALAAALAKLPKITVQGRAQRPVPLGGAVPPAPPPAKGRSALGSHALDPMPWIP